MYQFIIKILLKCIQIQSETQALPHTFTHVQVQALTHSHTSTHTPTQTHSHVQT